jgi:putative tryptophan/tyrosine transport system substrate-binding protein
MRRREFIADLAAQRWVGDDADRIRLYATELTGMRPDVIWASGSLPLLLLKRTTRTIPVVFTQVYDPVGSGFVTNLTRPSGNITGFTLGEFSMGGKTLEVLKEVAPPGEPCGGHSES